VGAAFERQRLGQPADAVLAGGIGGGMRPRRLRASDALLTMRPPRGFCAFIWRKAARAHRNAPVRLMAIVSFH